MMLELHNVTIRPQVSNLSLTVDSGQLLCVTGRQGAGKTTLLRAVLGFLPIDGGHISIDGELLTPQSAPYFRRQMAYVPQHLSVPEGYTEVTPDYMALLRKAVTAGKSLLIVDEPPTALSADDAEAADRLLAEAARRGATVLAVNGRITQNRISL